MWESSEQPFIKAASPCAHLIRTGWFLKEYVFLKKILKDIPEIFLKIFSNKMDHRLL